MKSGEGKSGVLVVVLALASMVLAFQAGRNGPRLSPGSDRSAERSFGATSQHRTRVWRQAVAGRDAASRTLKVLDLLDSCQKRGDFLDAIAFIESSADKSEKNRYLAEVFAAWLEKDPQAALGEVRRVESLRYHAERVAESFLQWASKNPTSATDLLARALDGRQNDAAAKPVFLDGIDPPEFLLSCVAGIGQSDPGLAADVLARSAASSVRTSAIEVLLQGWDATSPDSVRSWAASIKEPSTRRIAVEVAATKAGQKDSTEDGLQWAMALPEQGDREAALRALTSQWSERHSAAAFAWACNLTDEPLKLSLMPGVLKHLAIIDPGAAADWLNQYEASPAMDASIVSYAMAIQHVNPAAALASVEAITDPVLRAEVIERIEKQQPPTPGPGD